MGGGYPVRVSLMGSVSSEVVCVRFSLEASTLYGRWHVQWNVYDKRVDLLIRVEWSIEYVFVLMCDEG